MNPVSRDLHVDGLLTEVSIGYTNADYIADKIFPVCPVKKRSDIVPKFDQSHFFRQSARKRAAGTKSEGVGFTVDTTDKYFADRYSFRFEIPDEVRDNADEPFNLDVTGTEYVTDQMQLCREVNFAGDFFKTGVWATDKDGTGNTDFTQFSDYGASTPLVTITDFKDAMEGMIGREPNVYVLGKLGYSKLKWHPELVDTIKYTQRAQLTPELIASLLEFETLLIGRAIQTTDPVGTAESAVNYSRIWGKNALMIYRPARPSLMTPAAGYAFVWARVASAVQYIKRMRDEEREVDIIEGNSYFDQKMTAARAGLFMKAITA